MAFRIDDSLPTWRKVALSTWRRGDDPSIYGSVDLDATAMQDYVRRAREHSGVHVTLTHLVGKAVAVALAKNPDCNGVVSFGRLKVRDTVDVFFQVAFDGGKNLAGAKVVAADQLSVVQIAQKLTRGTERIRKRGDTELQRTTGMMKYVPAPMLGAVLRATEFAAYDLGLNLSRVGVPFDAFGSVMVTNVGVFGIERGFAPLMPLSRTPALLCIGQIRDGVVPVDGRPAVRPVISIGATFDHRVIDGYHAGKLSRIVREVLVDPVAHLGAPDALARDEAGNGAGARAR
jgi:pyruvate dehydrogenase E2 component (dihydrolipoamide acetyltransferase)